MYIYSNRDRYKLALNLIKINFTIKKIIQEVDRCGERFKISH